MLRPSQPQVYKYINILSPTGLLFQRIQDTSLSTTEPFERFWSKHFPGFYCPQNTSKVRNVVSAFQTPSLFPRKRAQTSSISLLAHQNQPLHHPIPTIPNNADWTSRGLTLTRWQQLAWCFSKQTNKQVHLPSSPSPPHISRSTIPPLEAWGEDSEEQSGIDIKRR